MRACGPARARARRDAARRAPRTAPGCAPRACRGSPRPCRRRGRSAGPCGRGPRSWSAGRAARGRPARRARPWTAASARRRRGGSGPCGRRGTGGRSARGPSTSATAACSRPCGRPTPRSGRGSTSGCTPGAGRSASAGTVGERRLLLDEAGDHPGFFHAQHHAESGAPGRAAGGWPRCPPRVGAGRPRSLADLRLVVGEPGVGDVIVLRRHEVGVQQDAVVGSPAACSASAGGLTHPGGSRHTLARPAPPPGERRGTLMREAVVVSYARTGLAKSARGGFNMTPAMSMAAHAIAHAVEKSSVEPDAVEDVYLGNGAHGAGNLARLSGLLAGLPVDDGRGDDPAALLVGPQRHRPGRQLHQGGRRRRRRRRRRRVDLHAQPGLRWPGEHGPGADRDVPGHLHGDDRDRRHRRRALRRQPRVPGRVLAAVPAAHGRRPGARAVRRGDRADGDEDEARRQRDQGGVDRRLRRRPRRVQPPVARRSRAWPSCSRSAARATTSRPATPASCPTAPPPWC